MKIENNDHEVVYLEIGEMKAYIDELMLPIIKILWENNIKTNACCQELKPGFAHIAFRTSEDASNFIKLVFGKEKTELIKNENVFFKDRLDSLSNIEKDLLAWGSRGISWTCAFLYEGHFVIHFNFPKDRINELIEGLKK